MKKLVRFAAVTLAAVLATGCATKTTYVDPNADDVVVMGLDYKDFSKAADQAVVDIQTSPLMVHPQVGSGARYIIAVSKIVNDTTQRIDTAQLSKKIRVDLLRSGRFITTTAIGLNGAEDEMTAQVRKLKKSKLANQKTVKKNGTVVAPDFSLSGKIIQRNHKVDSSTQQMDYYFQLTLTNLDNGLAYYEGEYPIIKRGSNKSVSW
ncbi:penicillin-binding protein activator LpoB [Endozoicomonas sp. OPT23]|uniref:penicillin-binding protein activator LpoB n=1 Tax=Endozoicomonas sp. OPT23 TaxID=2072845 RepID=UPI00129BFC4C|nr:penicillin-binding protein activator LpoB [Endozoicomonas sp. OPT23]MRI33993.1 penicillin-binding protein activator LpoB [Endozoicomonas sp. OPT23]